MNIKTANRLCDLRKQHGYSQEELASKLGVSRQAVSKWERAESSPDTDNLIELARLYNISLDELINEKEASEILSENKKASETKNVIDDNISVTDDEGNSIEIKNGHINIKDDEGGKVEVHGDKVIITDKNGKTKTINKEQYQEKIFYRKHPFLNALNASWALIIVTAYLILGFVLGGEGWANYWFLFILIPVLPSIISAIIKRKISSICYPCIAAAVYCALGMFLGLWHPTWVIFITIPVFYIIADPIDKYCLHNKDEEFNDED